MLSTYSHFSLQLKIGMPIPLSEIQDVYCVFLKDDRYYGNALLGNTTATAFDSNGTTLFCQTPDFNLSSLTINGNLNEQHDDKAKKWHLLAANSLITLGRYHG